MNKSIQVYGSAPLKHVFKILHSVAQQLFRQSPWLTKVRFGGARVIVRAVVFERGKGCEPTGRAVAEGFWLSKHVGGISITVSLLIKS